MMKKRDVLIIVLVLVAALGAFSYTQSRPPERMTIPANTAGRVEPTTPPEETAAPKAEDQPRTTAAPAETADAQTGAPPAAEPTAANAQSAVVGPPVPQRIQTNNYVVIEVKSKRWGDPIPMDMDKEITVRQENGTVNVVSITPTSVKMHSSTCENQDCVYQDEIPINYMETNRILGNLIVCLPNQVVIRLVAGEEEAP